MNNTVGTVRAGYVRTLYLLGPCSAAQESVDRG